MAATEVGLQKLKGLVPSHMSGGTSVGGKASSMTSDLPQCPVDRNPAPGEPNLSNTVIKGKEALQKAIDEFHNFVSQRQLATAWQTSYHITFAKEITEAMWQDFLEHASENGLTIGSAVDPDSEETVFTQSDLDSSRATLEIVLKARVAQRLYRSEAWYPVFNTIDPMIKQALQLWNHAESLATTRTLDPSSTNGR